MIKVLMIPFFLFSFSHANAISQEWKKCKMAYQCTKVLSLCDMPDAISKKSQSKFHQWLKLQKEKAGPCINSKELAKSNRLLWLEQNDPKKLKLVCLNSLCSLSE